MALSLLLDASGSMQVYAGPVRRAALLVINEFVRGDRVNIGVFDHAVQISNGFTANRARILWSLDQALTAAETPCNSPDNQRPVGQRYEPRTPPSPGRGTAIWDGVWCGIRELERDTESIRKVMVLITDGKENTSVTSEQTAMRLAHAVGVVIFTVGFQGVEAANARKDIQLRQLAADTGGGYFSVDPRDPLEPVFSRIGEELRGQYVLGFEPGSASSVGALKVGIKTPGLKVRARTRY
jgi:VWFA-related protein